MSEKDFLSLQIDTAADRSLGARLKDKSVALAVILAVFLLAVSILAAEERYLVLSLLALGGGLLFAFQRTPGAVERWRTAVSHERPLVGAFGTLLVVVFPLFFIDNPYMIHVATLAGIYGIIALGLNVVVGFCGLIDVGAAVYFSVGAYVSSQLSVLFDVSFWIGLPLAGLGAALFGFLIAWPAMRLQEHYLALLTLGYSQMIVLLERNLTFLTNGTDGVINIPPPRIGSFSFLDNIDLGWLELPFQINFYYLTAALVGLTCLATWRFRVSSLGHQWDAVREEDRAAAAFGIDIRRVKIAAFVIGSFFGGIGGATFAHMIGFIHPDNFVLSTSIMFLAMVIIGGRGSIGGVLLSAALLTFIPEKLRELDEMRLLMFALFLLATMFLRPGGLLPVRRLRWAIPRTAMRRLIELSGKRSPGLGEEAN